MIAVPKGRVLGPLAERFARAGVDKDVLLGQSRKLVRVDARTGLSFLMLKPDDVPTYVEYGAADLGVVGRDVLLEREYDLYAPLDLGIGICRMVVAGVKDLHGKKKGAAFSQEGHILRVATKYPNIAARHFASKGESCETVYVQGSVELAPLTGLADCIVDLVETGETLRSNGLVELETVCNVSTVVIANRVGLKLKKARIAPLLELLATPEK